MTHMTGNKNSITGQVKIWTMYQPCFRRGLLAKSSYRDKGMKSGVHGIPGTEYLLVFGFFLTLLSTPFL